MKIIRNVCKSIVKYVKMNDNYNINNYGGVNMDNFEQLSALDLAKYIVNRCINKDKPISNLQLQKILYFLYIFVFNNYKKELFNNKIEAWQYGPVLPDVYNLFWINGAMKIIETQEINMNVINLPNKIDDEIDRLCNKYAWDLVSESHEEGTPWKQVYKPLARKEIPMELIQKLGKIAR